MAQSRTIETIVGVFVVAGMLALLALAMQVSNLSSFGQSAGYRIVAQFENIGGLKVRSPVKMSGVRIGEVAEIRLDPQSHEAVAVLSIAPAYNRIPVDTTADIYTAGLLGEQYIALNPGGEETFLKDGGRIEITSSAVVLERVISQFLYNKAAGDK